MQIACQILWQTEKESAELKFVVYCGRLYSSDPTVYLKSLRHVCMWVSGVFFKFYFCKESLEKVLLISFGQIISILRKCLDEYYVVICFHQKNYTYISLLCSYVEAKYSLSKSSHFMLLSASTFQIWLPARRAHHAKHLLHQPGPGCHHCSPFHIHSRCHLHHFLQPCWCPFPRC